MNNKKFAKILSLILALAAMITCMVAMNVSAETATPELKSVNLIYGDQIQIMFGTNIPTTEPIGNLKVAYYKKNPATNPEAEVFYANYLPADSEYNYKVDGVPCWTFVTDGIPASAVSQERFATVFYGDTVPADATYKSYSVMEYLFTRLYKQDFISKENGTIDGNKKNLYLNMIDYTAFAQQVLINDKDQYEDIQLITEYIYVYAKGASINGLGSSLILAEAGDVTLALNAGMAGFEGWTVKTYNKDGTATSERFKGQNTFTISAHTVIEPLADPTVIEFDDWAAGLVTADSNYRISSFTEGTNTNPGSNFSIINDNGNAKLLYNGPYSGTSDTFHVSAHNSSENANVTILEMDIEWLQAIDSRSNLFNIDLYAGNECVYTVTPSLNNGYAAGDGTSSRIRLGGKDGTGVYTNGDDSITYKHAYGDSSKAVYLAPKEIWRDSTNTLDWNDSGVDRENGHFNQVAVPKKCSYQFKLRIEYYYSVDDGNGGKTDIVKWYLDDVCIGLYDNKQGAYADHKVPTINSLITSVYLRCADSSRPVVYTIDNLRIENTEKAYEAYVPKPY